MLCKGSWRNHAIDKKPLCYVKVVHTIKMFSTLTNVIYNNYNYNLWHHPKTFLKMVKPLNCGNQNTGLLKHSFENISAERFWEQ